MRDDAAHTIRTARALLTSLEGRIAMLSSEGVRQEVLEELRELLDEIRASLQRLP